VYALRVLPDRRQAIVGLAVAVTSSTFQLSVQDSGPAERWWAASAAAVVVAAAAPLSFLPWLFPLPFPLPAAGPPLPQRPARTRSAHTVALDETVIRL
jgi:hypothetical protein